MCSSYSLFVIAYLYIGVSLFAGERACGPCAGGGRALGGQSMRPRRPGNLQHFTYIVLKFTRATCTQIISNTSTFLNRVTSPITSSQIVWEYVYHIRQSRLLYFTSCTTYSTALPFTRFPLVYLMNGRAVLTQCCSAW